MAQVVLNEQGVPVMLADVPNSGIAVRRKSASRGGNPYHDSRSGKFTSGPKEDDGPTPPPNVQREAYLRWLDAVRDAARRFPGHLSEANIETFLRSRARNPNAVNIAAFIQSAGQQQMDDIVDILSPHTGEVRVTASESFIKGVLTNLAPEKVEEVTTRIAARVGDREKALKIVQKYLPSKNKSTSKNKNRNTKSD